MELKNMTIEELNELKNEINYEVELRRITKGEEYQKKLSSLIEQIINDDCNIRLFGYNTEYGNDTEIMIDSFNNDYGIFID